MPKAQLPTPLGRSELPEEITTNIRVSAPFDSKALRNRVIPSRRRLELTHEVVGRVMILRGSAAGHPGEEVGENNMNIPVCQNANIMLGRCRTHLPIPFTGCVPFLATGGHLAPFCTMALSKEPSASPHFRLFFQWQSTWGAHSICDPISQL